VSSTRGWFFYQILKLSTHFSFVNLLLLWTVYSNNLPVGNWDYIHPTSRPSYTHRTTKSWKQLGKDYMRWVCSSAPSVCGWPLIVVPQLWRWTRTWRISVPWVEGCASKTNPWYEGLHSCRKILERRSMQSPWLSLSADDAATISFEFTCRADKIKKGFRKR
jgi:hypothetical protein